MMVVVMILSIDRTAKLSVRPWCPRDAGMLDCRLIWKCLCHHSPVKQGLYVPLCGAIEPLFSSNDSLFRKWQCASS